MSYIGQHKKRLQQAKTQEEIDSIVKAAHQAVQLGAITQTDFGQFLAHVLDRREQLRKGNDNYV